MGMKKEFSGFIEVDFSDSMAKTQIFNALLTGNDMYVFRWWLNEAIKACEAHNKEQKLKDHPSLFPDETDQGIHP